MKRRETWEDYAALFVEMQRTLQAEWSLESPSYETLPSSDLELAVDCWCAIQAQNLNKRLTIPVEVRPWMLARLRMAIGMALEASITCPQGPPPLEARGITQMLCGEWHDGLRERWIALGRLQRRGRVQPRVRIAVLALVAAILIGGIIVRAMR